jgi:glycosyltransferase involved in cell wall biosynthesis
MMQGSIYVDVSSAVHAKAGLSRYAQNLVRELRSLLGPRLRLFQNSLGRRGPLAGWADYPTRGVVLGYKPWRMAVWLGHVLRIPMNRLLPDAALFHATEHLLPYLSHIPTVLTVHDLVFERYPQYHKTWNHLYLKSAMPLFCQRATAIVAISEATKSDLCACYHVDPGKITVIPEAADPRFSPRPPELIQAVRRRYGLPAHYILSVGTIEPRKNLARLVDACGPILQDGLVDGLVLVGGKGWLYEGFFRHLQELPWQSKIILPGFVADEDLPALYAGALATVQPSLWEGFGLPVLEAMACGSPVCASEVSSLPEVGGDAVRYFDPTQAEQITSVLVEVLRDASLRQEMRQRGLSRAAAFSWRRTAEQTVALYERILRREP